MLYRSIRSGFALCLVGRFGQSPADIRHSPLPGLSGSPSSRALEVGLVNAC